MRQNYSVLLLLFGLIPGGAMADTGLTIELPAPKVTGSTSLEHVIAQRRSQRQFTNSSLTIGEVGQLLWSAQGITDPKGLRAAPSAGALYPLEIYVVAGTIEDMAPGIYHYRPDRHQLIKTESGDSRMALARAALSQDWIADAAAVVVFTADYRRTMRKYAHRSKRYVHIETGHAAENLFLQAQSLGLATVIVGAFDDDALASVLRLPAELQPLLLMPVGRD